MNIVAFLLIASVHAFWLHILIGLAVTTVASFWIGRIHPSWVMKGILPFLAPGLLCLFIEDAEGGGHLPDIPVFVAALELLLLNLLVLFILKKSRRKTASSLLP